MTAFKLYLDYLQPYLFFLAFFLAFFFVAFFFAIFNTSILKETLPYWLNSRALSLDAF